MLVFFLLSLVLFSCTCIFSLVRSIAAYTYFTLVYLLSRVPCVSFEYECSLSCVCVSFKYLFSVCHQHANHSSDTRFSSYAFSTYERSSVWRVENYIFSIRFLMSAYTTYNPTNDAYLSWALHNRENEPLNAEMYCTMYWMFNAHTVLQ